MNTDWQISVYVCGHDGRRLAEKEPDKPRESSSTIKIPVLVLTLQKMCRDRAGLDFKLPRLARHASRGSGILNWTDASMISLADLISTTFIYSDCLATNMLIDYVGGQTCINRWLDDNGYKTRLLMPYLYFSDPEATMPKVGITSAREMAELYRQLDQSALSADLHKHIDQVSRQLHESWLELNLPAKLEGLSHKTGSLINSAPDGETVLNAAGSLLINDQLCYFGLLSRGRLDRDDETSEATAKRWVARQLYQTVAAIAN